MAKAKSWSMNQKQVRNKLKICENCMKFVETNVGKKGDGATGAVPGVGATNLISTIECLNNFVWSDGKKATNWYNSMNKTLQSLYNCMKSLNSSFERLDAVQELNISSS